MGFSIWSLVVILLIVLLLFGTKKLRNIGGDLGGAIRGFKESVQEGEQAGGDTESTTENQAGKAPGSLEDRSDARPPLQGSDQPAERTSAERQRDHNAS